MILHAFGRLEMADVIDAAGGEVVKQNDAVAAVEQPLREVRTDKTSAASDQISQRASLQGLRVVVLIARNAKRDGFGIVIMSVGTFGGFLGTIAIGIRIIAVRVVVVRSAGIDGIENDAENAALDAMQQVARARESFLGCFATANDEQHTIGLHGKNYGIGGGHDGRRI